MRKMERKSRRTKIFGLPCLLIEMFLLVSFCCRHACLKKINSVKSPMKKKVNSSIFDYILSKQ